MASDCKVLVLAREAGSLPVYLDLWVAGLIERAGAFLIRAGLLFTAAPMFLADPQGFEPGLTVLETDVQPVTLRTIEAH